MKRILLVDDNETDRLLYRRYLGRQLGYENIQLEEAASAAEAVALFEQRQPDCVLLDHNLPDTEGLDLLLALKRLAPPDSLCAVMITGGGNEKLAVQALNAGALDYLVKQQFDQELLAKTVLHAIEKNEWRQYQTRYHDELHHINQQLRDSRHELTAANQQLLQTNGQLTRANADLDNFVYAASHDLKQPVNNLRGLFDELRRSAVVADAAASKIWQLVDNSLRVLSTTITDLGTVVQEARQPGLPPAEDEILFATLAADVEETLRPQLQECHAVVELDFAALPVVRYSHRSLRTIVLNLMANGLKYRDPQRPPQLRLRSYLAGGHPVLAVQDNGLGIDLHRHGDELFQLFRRFHPEAAPGTGVGLFLVNRLVQAQGGHIEVASELGVGTTFSVHLRG